MRFYNLFLFFLISLVLSEKSNKKKSNKISKDKVTSKDEIENIYNWAKKNNII